MPAFTPSELDVMSRAYHRAFDELNGTTHDAEEAKAVLMSGILDAANQGERDEDKLVECALAAIRLFEEGIHGNQSRIA